ncbi:MULTISPECIES: RHS repeat-associated core domain-containing protein, partial [unclassified Idiomarina]|uniref:RHS repeat-associated core domain-containing protein n=1 Tax=unclassified Idiomarina TaxID=2614829 RepID=UPI00138A091F
MAVSSTLESETLTVPGHSQPFTVDYRYNNGLDRLIGTSGNRKAGNASVDYDALGNITNNSHVEMSYNLANQMTAALGKSYTYDGHNRRVKVAGDGDTRYYLYSQSGQLLLSEDNGVQTNYIYLGNRLIAEDRQATTTFIHTDRLGSPVARTNSAGRVESRRHYQPFGDTYEAPSDDIGYTGHKYDNDSGLSYMQARYYDPVIGRFYSNDPVGFDPNNIDSFGRYTYGNNNPYKYNDPDGRTAHPVIELPDLSTMMAKAFGYESTTQGNQNFAKDMGNAAQQIGMDVAHGTTDILTSKPVQNLGDKLGYVPIPQAQAVSTAINTAALVFDGDAAGLSGDLAGNAAGVQAEKTHAGRGGSLKAQAYNYVVDKAVGTVVSSGVEVLQN